MSINTTLSDRQHRALRVTAVVIMALSMLMAGMAGTAAAQEDSEPVAPCEDGPPVPGQGTGNGSDTESGPLELVFINDDSNSMTTSVNGETRMDILKDSVTGFIQNSEDSAEFGHVSMAPPTEQATLTTDHQSVIDTVEGLDASDGTGQDEAAALDLASEELQSGTNADEDATKVMVFVADGEVYGDEQAAREEAQTARENGVTIFSVGIGDQVDEQFLIDIAGDESRYYESAGGDLEGIYDEIQGDVEAIGGDLTVDTRPLYQPNSTHPYEVTETTYYDNGSVEREDVTENATVSTSNASLLSVNDAEDTLSATDDANVSTWVRVDATAGGVTGCTNVIVAAATVENLELLPNNTWRFSALFFEEGGGLNFLFVLLIATLFAVPMARFTSAFGGLAVAEMVLVIGWFAGYVSFGMAAVSVFVALFIGLNLAANIDYQAGSIRR